MKNGLTEILCVIDKSGSMSSLVQDTIGGFNSFIEDQKKVVGEARVSLTLFDTNYDSLYMSTPIQRVTKLTERQYCPSGMTALLDAVGKTIDEAGKEFAKRDESERPEKVIMVIITDGEENSSREYKKDALKTLIEKQMKEWNWEFIYLGANQDAFAEAGGLCISNAANFACNSASIGNTYSGISRSVVSYRAGGVVNLDQTSY